MKLLVTRRRAIAAGAGLVAAASLTRHTAAQTNAPTLSPDDARTLARDAWVFGVPLVYIDKQIDTLTHVARP
jgi:hypothetical protein